MSKQSIERNALFSVGQLVHHTLFDYRGVIVDVDPHFLGTEDWYRNVAASRPPKDNPWYHVLVDGFAHRTYVAERNLEPDTEGGPIKHEELGEFFGDLEDGRYVLKRRGN